MSFQQFRDGVGGEVMRRAGVSLAGCQSWQDYAAALRARGSALVEAVRAEGPVLSTGERGVLCAALVAGDYAWLADEIADGGAWQQISRTGGDYRSAVLSALAAWHSS